MELGARAAYFVQTLFAVCPVQVTSSICFILIHLSPHYLGDSFWAPVAIMLAHIGGKISRTSRRALGGLQRHAIRKQSTESLTSALNIHQLIFIWLNKRHPRPKYWPEAFKIHERFCDLRQRPTPKKAMVWKSTVEPSISMHRLRPLLILAYWMPCFLSILSNTVTLTLVPTFMVGKMKTPSNLPERYVSRMVGYPKCANQVFNSLHSRFSPFNRKNG